MKLTKLPNGSWIDLSEIKEIATLEESPFSLDRDYIPPRTVIHTHYGCHIVYFESFYEAGIYSAILAAASNLYRKHGFSLQ